MEFPGGFLLEGGGGEGGSRSPQPFLLFEGIHLEFRPYAVFQIFPGLGDVLEPGVQGGVHLNPGGRSCGMEDGGGAVVRFVLEGKDLPFPIHYEPEGHALHPSRAEFGLDLPPKDG